MYYFFVKDGKINGKGEARIISEGWECVEVSQEVYEDDTNKYIYENGEIVDAAIENVEYIPAHDDVADMLSI